MDHLDALHQQNIKIADENRSELARLTALVAEQQRRIEEGEKRIAESERLIEAEDLRQNGEIDDRDAWLEEADAKLTALQLSARQMKEALEKQSWWLSSFKPYGWKDAAEVVDAALQAAASLDLGPDWRKEADEPRGIYVASKTRHAQMWKDLRAAGWPIISTWIDEAGEGESASLSDLWRRCITESMSADAMLLYCADGDVLKGAWIELGAALAHGRKVFAVGIRQFTVANHELISHFDTVEGALSALADFNAALRPAASLDLGPDWRKEAEKLAEAIVRDVAELPDRSSPEEQPEMMLVSERELLEIVIAALSDYRAKGGDPTP
jgi:hypothetical protein